MTDNKKRVLVWRDSWLPYSQTFVRDHIRSLDRYEPLAAGLVVENEDYADLVQFCAFPDNRLSRLHKLKFKVFGFRRLTHFIRDNDVDVVHAHFGPGALNVLRSAKSLDVPLVVTFHGFDVTSMPHRGFRGLMYRLALQGLFRYASRVLPVSEFLRSALLDLGAPASRVLTHYLGTSAQPTPTPLDFAQRSGVLFVGRLAEVKGGMLLLNAISRTPELQAIPVTVVGEGPERQRMEDFAMENSLNVRFVGSVAHSDVLALMDHHRIFCVPSHKTGSSGPEAFGMVFAEAAMRGLPICSVSEGGIPEIVNHGVTGLLCDAGEPEELGTNISKLYFDAATWNEFSRAGIKQASSLFDLSSQTRKLELIYDSLVR